MTVRSWFRDTYDSWIAQKYYWRGFFHGRRDLLSETDRVYDRGMAAGSTIVGAAIVIALGLYELGLFHPKHEWTIYEHTTPPPATRVVPFDTLLERSEEKTAQELDTLRSKISRAPRPHIALPATPKDTVHQYTPLPTVPLSSHRIRPYDIRPRHIHRAHTDAILPMPHGATKAVSDGETWIESPAVKEDDTIIFNPGIGDYGARYNYDAIGVNLVVDNEIIGQGFAPAGNNVRISSYYHDGISRLDSAIAQDRPVHYQVMALRQRADGEYDIVASYRNGTITSFTENASLHRRYDDMHDTDDVHGKGTIRHESTDSTDDRGDSSSLLPSKDNSLRPYLPSHTQDYASDAAANLESRTAGTILSRYLGHRNASTLDGMVASDYGTMIDEAAQLYKDAASQGLSHQKSLDYVADNASMAAIQTRDDAYDAIRQAQDRGSDVIFSRWDAKRYGDQAVDEMKRLRAQGLSQRRIAEEIGRMYRSNISRSTVARYLGQQQAMLAA